MSQRSKRCVIVVFDDDETYAPLESVRVVEVTAEELEQVNEGTKVGHVVDLEARGIRLHRKK